MNPQTPFYIYALLDPRTREPRYVGGTRDIVRRNTDPPGKWMYSEGNDTKNAWIQDLIRRGNRPELVQLEVATEGNWLNLRREWIGRLKKQGFQLLNANKARRCRAASLALWRSDDFRDKVRRGREAYNECCVDEAVASMKELPEFQPTC